ncbi:MAG: hypothetical protein QOE65_2986 [Solirubrobacteraceae bacterium]|jgi:hypothetical protein|nr:hypothetical protein [Solirubrobacteraceae bacterium]
MHRADRIALFARRFALLARRPDLDSEDVTHRVAVATDPSPVPLNLLDAVQAAGAGDADRLCTNAVRMLRRGGPGKAAVLDLLGVLEPDRLVGIYYALPEDRRAAVLSDPAWAHHVAHAPDDVAEAMARHEADLPGRTVATTPAEQRAHDQLVDFRRGALTGGLAEPT